ncbi:hypothetical protein OHA25_35450 [Nonomuraea sp. NBC_00507]|uniref:hypothetical protein n=1 Tax=Nonomuraea sp. NBC_00507 TaxID=2976002 RepID=UPI002E19B31B
MMALSARAAPPGSPGRLDTEDGDRGPTAPPSSRARTSLDARTSSPDASAIIHGGHPFRRAIRSTRDANDSPYAGATTNASRRGQSAAISRAEPPAVHVPTVTPMAYRHVRFQMA